MPPDKNDKPSDKDKQAEQAVQAVQSPVEGADAGPAIEEMQQSTIRAALSDFEQRLADQMRQAEDQFSAQQQTIDDLTRQLHSVQLHSGPPLAAMLAESLSQRVQSIASANPDLGRQHFAGVVSQAQSLADEVKAVQAGKGDPARAEALAYSVGSFFTRTHPRVSGKVLEGGNSALDEAERIVDELQALTPEPDRGVMAAPAKKG